MIMGVPLLLTLLSGCIGGDEPLPLDDTSSLSFLPPTLIDPGQYQSHPAYGYPTNGMLPVSTDGETRVVNDDGTIQWFRPAGKPLPATLTGMTAVTQVDGASGGAGIAVFGPLAFIGGRSAGPLNVVDISNPEAPVLVGSAADVPVRDADPILYPDGRLVVITTAGGREQFATDVTDPANPKNLVAFETANGNHNIAVVPGTPIVYNSGSGDTIDIVDYTDPEAPVALGTFKSSGCHDITFFLDIDREMFRAYCAGYSTSQIWDITNPAAPEFLIAVDYPNVQNGVPVAGGTLPDSGRDMPLSFSHLAMVSHDGNVLVVGDETGGGAANACDVYANAAGTTVSGPSGNLWFYDLTDEMNPILKGHLSPNAAEAAGGSCTAHFGRVIEDTGMLVMGFYAAGVLLVDFTDLDNPRIVDRLDHTLDPTSSIWDVQYHQGYLFTGDMSRGMDIATFL